MKSTTGRHLTNGVELHYVIDDGTAGAGPWIVLSHSLACNVSMWDEQAALLAQRFRVLRFDTRGHGQSSAPLSPYSLDDLAADVHGLLLHLGITRCHWIGLSMGGMIGETYALAHPDVFQSLVLADTTSKRPPNAREMWGDRIRMAREQGMDAVVPSTLARWFTEPFRKARPDVMTRIGADIRSTPVEGFCGCCEAISRVDLLHRLPEIRCPVLVMVGDQDHGTPPEMARQIHENLPGSSLVIIPDASHISNIEQPERFNRAVLDFVAMHAPAGRG